MKITERVKFNFLQKITRKEDDECWEWCGRYDKNGYGKLGLKWAHRISYVVFVGEIPDGLEYQIDHLCKNRKCVNPKHLELVSQYENNMRSNSITAKEKRQTHCLRGHELSDENIYANRGNKRQCKQCHRIRAKENYRRK